MLCHDGKKYIWKTKNFTEYFRVTSLKRWKIELTIFSKQYQGLRSTMLCISTYLLFCLLFQILFLLQSFFFRMFRIWMDCLSFFSHGRLLFPFRLHFSYHLLHNPGPPRAGVPYPETGQCGHLTGHSWVKICEQELASFQGWWADFFIGTRWFLSCLLKERY